MIALTLPILLHPERFVAVRPLSDPAAWIVALRRLATTRPRKSHPLQDATIPLEELSLSTWQDAEWR